MKRILAILALAALVAFTSRADAATFSFGYTTTFNNLSGLGLAAGDTVSAEASFDPAGASDLGGGLFEAVLGGSDTLSISFGNFTFQLADDLLGGPLVGFVGDQVAYLDFFTQVTVGGVDYAIEFSRGFLGPGFTVTPATSVQDFVAAGTLGVAVPEPATLALLGLGLGLVGFARRRA